MIETTGPLTPSEAANTRTIELASRLRAPCWSASIAPVKEVIVSSGMHPGTAANPFSQFLLRSYPYASDKVYRVTRGRGHIHPQHTNVVLPCDDLARRHGYTSANPHWDRRLVIQGLGWGSLPAGGVAEESSSRRIPGTLLRRHRDQHFFLRTHPAGTGTAVVPESGGGQSEFCFHRQAASVVHAFAAGGDGTDIGGKHPSE